MAECVFRPLQILQRPQPFDSYISKILEPISTSSYIKHLIKRAVEGRKGCCLLKHVVNGTTLSGAGYPSSTCEIPISRSTSRQSFFLQIYLRRKSSWPPSNIIKIVSYLLYLYLLEVVVVIRPRDLGVVRNLHTNLLWCINTYMQAHRYTFLWSSDPVLPFLQRLPVPAVSFCHSISQLLFLMSKDLFDVSACVVYPDTEEARRKWDDIWLFRIGPVKWCRQPSAVFYADEQYEREMTLAT
jgi:hypothetical protein